MKNILFLLICLVVLGGCDVSQSILTLSSGEDGANKTNSQFKNMDDYLAEVADKVPGFAGYYYDPKSGAMTMWLKSEDDKAKAVEALLPYMEAKQLGVIDMEGFKKMEFLVRISNYDFRQLLVYQEMIGRSVKISHFSFSDVNEAQNKVTIGIYDMTEKPQILLDCAKVGIPSDAVEVIFRQQAVFYGG